MVFFVISGFQIPHGHGSVSISCWQLGNLPSFMTWSTIAHEYELPCARKKPLLALAHSLFCNGLGSYCLWRNRPFAGLQHQAQFGLNPAMKMAIFFKMAAVHHLGFVVRLFRPPTEYLLVFITVQNLVRNYSSSCTLPYSVLWSLPFTLTTTFVQMKLSSSSVFTHSTLTQTFLTFKTRFNRYLYGWLLIFLFLTLLSSKF